MLHILGFFVSLCKRKGWLNVMNENKHWHSHKHLNQSLTTSTTGMQNMATNNSTIFPTNMLPLFPPHSWKNRQIDWNLSIFVQGGRWGGDGGDRCPFWPCLTLPKHKKLQLILSYSYKMGNHSSFYLFFCFCLFLFCLLFLEEPHDQCIHKHWSNWRHENMCVQSSTRNSLYVKQHN